MRCRVCLKPLRQATVGKPDPSTRLAHCRNPQCDWCEPCFNRRAAECGKK